jgi:UDPglucose 6-dehydrogenase
MARIAVVGTGYVGLTTGAYLAHLRHEVVCADVVASKVERLNRGELPIVEEGLGELVIEGLAEQRLSFVLGAANAVPRAEFVFLCLPTPQGADGAADLSFLLAAAGEIAGHLESGAVVINKSTVPVGSAALVSQTLGRDDVFVVSNPEFLREGTAVYDCLNPDRIVVGGDDRQAVRRVAGLYDKLDAPVVMTDAASSEMIKYAANAFLATKLSFVNEIATLCERVGADVDNVVLGIGHDRRIGFEFLRPGPGWGGSCFPKDSRALVRIAQDNDHDFGLLRSVIEANEGQFDATTDKIVRMAGGSVAGKTIGVLGLAFKAGTDDLRDSPAMNIVQRLVAAGAKVQAYDPAVNRDLDGVDVMVDAYDVALGADVLAVLTEWPEFADINLLKLKELMNTAAIVDARNLFPPALMVGLGFAYQGIGRITPSVPANVEFVHGNRFDLDEDLESVA